MMSEAQGEAFVCGTCFLVFESEELLKIHSSTCAEEKPHVCPTCGEVFSEEREIREHNAQHHRAVSERNSDPDVGVKTEPVEETQGIQGESTGRRIEIQNSEMVSSAERPKVLVIQPIPEEEYKAEVASLPEEDSKPEVGSLPEAEPAGNRDIATDIVAEVQTHLQQFEDENGSTNGPASKFQVQVTPSTELESAETQAKKVIVVTVSKVDEETPEPTALEPTKQKTDQRKEQKRKAPYSVRPRPITARDWSSESEGPSGETLRKCTHCDAWFVTRDKYHKHIMSQHTNVYFCKLCDKVLLSVSIFERHMEWHKRKTQEQQTSQLLPEMTPKYMRTKMIKMVRPGAPRTAPVIWTPTKNSNVLGNAPTIQSPVVHSELRETFHVVRTPMVKSEVPETTLTATTIKTGSAPDKPPVVEYTMKLGNTHVPNCASRVQDTVKLSQEGSEAQNRIKTGEKISELQTTDVKASMAQNTTRQGKKVCEFQNTVIPGETFQVVRTPMVKSEVPETTLTATTTKTGGVPDKSSVVEYTVKLGGAQIANSASKVQDGMRLGQQASRDQNVMKSGEKVSELQITGVKASMLQNASRLVQKAYELQNTMRTGRNAHEVQSTMKTNEKASEFKKPIGQCGICNNIFSSKQRKQYNTKNQYVSSVRCDHCGRTFTEVRDYNRHVATHNKDPTFIIRHALRPYSCPYCDKSLKTPHGLYRHLFTHVEERRYQCDICNSRFTAPFKLEKHKEQMHTNLRYQCHLCDKMVKTKGSMTIHLRRMHKSKGFAFTAVKLHAEVCPDDDSRPYKCDWCDKSYDKKWSLSVHVRKSHTGEKPYRCSYCKQLFSDSDALRAHAATTHTGGRLHRCDLCGKSFITIGELKKHVTTHVKTPMHTCLRCSQFFDYEAIQVGHVAVAHRSVRPYVCFYCMEEFEETVELVVHILTNHKTMTEDLKTGNSEEPYRCDACGKRFISMEDLARDILTHVYLKEFRKSSDTARLSFSYSVASATKPYRVHEEMSDALIKEELESSSSSTAASDTTELYDHSDDDRMNEEIPHTSVKEETNSAEGTENEEEEVSDNSIELKAKPLWPQRAATDNDEVSDVLIKEEEDSEHLVQCRKCKESFAEIKDLLQHVKEHGSDGNNFPFPLQCRLCNAYFSVTESLKLHLRTHREKCEAFGCVVCGRSFTNRWTMVQHMSEHSLEKPFECTVCGKSFAKKAVLDGHMLTHTGEKPLQCDHTEDHAFTCKVCANKSARKQYLDTFMKNRTGRPKPKKLDFSCPKCKKKFTSQQSVAAHQRVHTKPFPCDQCCQTFKDKAKLIVHKWRHHQ